VQILHPFAGSIQEYDEEIADPSRYRPDHCPQWLQRAFARSGELSYSIVFGIALSFNRPLYSKTAGPETNFNKYQGAIMTLTPEQEQHIVDMYLGAMSTNNIGKQLGFHKSYVVKTLRDRGIPLRFQTFSHCAEKMATLYTRQGWSGPQIAMGRYALVWRHETAGPDGSVEHRL
jgi:hypothetical protein